MRTAAYRKWKMLVGKPQEVGKSPVRSWKALETRIGNLDMKSQAIIFLSLKQCRNMMKVIFLENSSEFDMKRFDNLLKEFYVVPIVRQALNYLLV